MIARGREVRCLWVYSPDSEPCSAFSGILWELQRKVRQFHQSTETFWLHNGSVVNRNLMEFNKWKPPMPLPWSSMTLSLLSVGLHQFVFRNRNPKFHFILWLASNVAVPWSFFLFQVFVDFTLLYCIVRQELYNWQSKQVGYWSNCIYA